MAERVKVEFRPDFSGFVAAVERFAAAIGEALDPWQKMVLRAAYTAQRGEVLCGAPHGELEGRCPRCRASV